MLELKNIVKNYISGDTTVHALKGINLQFRKNEFVSVLGASGCGKTTLLNIIGGLDRYTSGDLIINGVSTKRFRDSDWDSYRNHSIGFVFQSYNLIPHQSVLSNVELALTLSGVSKAERRERAKEALRRVGLGDQFNKKPNQMSGGQMQRVAIARALVNNPDILLADEPTGALDTQTSIQIMELLKEVANDKLVIMVTHNPELAEKYSTRIVRLSDGSILSDSNPYFAGEVSEEPVDVKANAERKKKGERTGKKKSSMSFLTALSLSLNNLMTKKARTILTAAAGSIGIIGIALILSLSNGIQTYIDQVQEDTLSTYPITISKETQDYGAMFSAMLEVHETEDHSDSDKIYVDDSMGTMMSSMNSKIKNNLESFKKYVEEHNDELAGMVSDIQYTYDFDLQVYSEDGKTQVNPTTIFDNMGEYFASVSTMMSSSSSMMSGIEVMSEMIDNRELLEQQYNVIAGTWPTKWDEVVLVVDKNNQISKMTLYMLGVLDQSELPDIMNKLVETGEYEKTDIEPFTYDYFLNMKFNLLLNTDYFEKTDLTYTVDNVRYPIWKDVREAEDYDQSKFVNEKGTKLKIVGIIRPDEDAVASSISGAIAYTGDLTDMIMQLNQKSEITVQQLTSTPGYDVFTGASFEKKTYTRENITELLDSIDEQSLDILLMYIGNKTGMPITKEDIPAMVQAMDDQTFAEFVAILEKMVETKSTLEENLEILGYATEASPASINFYAKDFASKDMIEDFIASYNKNVSEADKISYTDLVGLMMSSITTIINVISYVLIAFVSISLVVSSIMIGIITYISVLERTKEIGILRSIGASKKDISRVFNAETLIIGFAAGAIGIIVTLILCIPINFIIHLLSGINNVGAILPWVGAIALILISMLLTFIAGLIPSGIAAKKDPVEALRSE